MSGNSSGSDHPGGGSSPKELKPSVSEADEGTGVKVNNACNSQAHSTTHCAQSETNQDLTGESDTPISAQSQSKGEININDGKLADDNEKGEKNKVTPREQDKVVHYAMQRAQNDNPLSYNYQDENFCAEKGRGLIEATVADQCEQYNSSRNAQADEVSTENFEKNGKHMVAEAAADVDHKIETGEHTSYENNKQMDQEDEKRSASPKQTLDQRNDTPSKSESVNLNQGDGKPTTPQTASSLAKGLRSTPQTENPNQENGTLSTSQMENPIQGDGKPSSSQVINPNQGNGKPTTPQTKNPNQENGTQSTSLMDIPNQGNGIPLTSQVKNPNQGNGILSTPQTENPNEGDGTPYLSQTENSNQGDGKLSSKQAKNPNQGDGKPSSSQTENPNQENSTSQTNNPNQGDGTPSSSQRENPNKGDGTPSTPQTENPNQGDGTPSTPQTENPNQGDCKPSLSQTENSNQGDGKPSSSQTENPNQENGTSQTKNPNQGNGKLTTSQTNIPNQGDGKLSSSEANDPNRRDGKPTTSQANIPNQGDGKPSSSQTENPNQENGKSPTKNSNQGDGTPLSSQTENPNQGDGTPTPQTENLNQGDGTPSTSQTKNPNQEDSIPSTSQTENLNQENGTQSTSQTMNPNQGDGTPSISQTENANQGDNKPLTSQSKNSNQGNGIPSVIGDKTHVNIDKGTADNIEKVKNDRTFELDAGNLHKSDGASERATTEEEGQYAIAKTQLAQSNIQVTEYASGQIEEGATWSEHPFPFLPFSFSQSQADSTAIEYQLEQIIDKVLTDTTIYEDKEEWKKILKRTLLRSFHPNVYHNMPAQNFDIHFAEKGIDNERTHRRLPTTPMSGSGTALSKTYRLEESSTSCMSDIELNQGHDRNKSNPTNVQPHDSRSEMTGYSGGGSPESLQTSDSESFDGQTSKTRTKESGSSSSGIADNLMIALGKGQAGMSSETTAKRDGTQSLRFPRPGSLSSRLPGPKILSIRWNKGKEEDIQGNETFELSLYRCNIISHVIRIACWPNDYHTLMFMFYNESTIENLKKSLYEKGYILKNGTQEIRFFTNIEKDPDQIKNEIEEVIKKFKVDFSIQSRCVESNLPDDKLAEKCIEFNEECKKDKRGNIVMTYSKSKGLWITGCDEDELKKHEKRLMEEVILQKNVIQNPTGISNSSMDILLISLDGREKKFGPLPIGSSNERKMLEIECSQTDFYKMSLIFQKEFSGKNDGLKFYPRISGKFPSVGILIKNSVGWVDIALKDVKTFLEKVLPTITAKRQKIQDISASMVNSWKKLVLQEFGGDVQVFCDEDDATCLWCVSEHCHLIEKSFERLFHVDDYKRKESSDPQSLLLYSLNMFEMEMCMEFNISDTLSKKHKEIIEKIFIDKAKRELAVTCLSKAKCAIKKDIQIFLDEKKETKTTINKIPKCFVNSVKMQFLKEEIGNEIPCCIDAHIDANEVHVYCNTQDDARKVVKIIEGLFQEENVDMEHLSTESLILKKKIVEWKKEFSEMVEIEITSKYIHLCGLRRIVEQILPQLKSFIQQKRTSASKLNIKDEFDQAKDVQDDAALEGEIWFEKEQEVQCLKAKDFRKRIEEIKVRYQCSVNIKMENAYPLMEKQSRKWIWLFQSGQKVVFENAELKDVEAKGSKCIITFLPETKQTNPGVCFPCADPTILKDIMLATVTLPTWRDGEAKEKEQLRSSVSYLLQCLRERNISTVVIPLMFDRLLLQWPINKILKAIFFWRRHFLDTTIFCHPDRDKCMKLLPVFQGMRDEPSRETIAIRIDTKKFTDEKVQVLVNTVGRDLILKNGHVSNSILLAAGNKIQVEANDKFPNGLLGGEVLVTDAYKLRGKGILKVFHGSLLRWNDFESIAVIKSFVAKCLHLASENGMTSIAFPALGTGNLGYEHKYVATAMFETVRSFIEGSLYTSVKEIVFNAFDPKSQQAFLQEEKKYLNNSCQSGTFLPRTYTFPENCVTFELYCGEVWAHDVKGLAVLYDSSEIFQKEDKTCIVECGKFARNFGGHYIEKQKLQSRQLHIFRQRVVRPVEWVFYLTWHTGYDLETANLALRSAEEENLDTLAFVISKKDGVAVKLDDIIRSVFAATKQTLKDSPLKRVIFVVDPALSSAANKTVEDNDIDLYNNEKKRCRVSFKCDSQTDLQNAKKDVMLALESLKNERFNRAYKNETNTLKVEDNEKGQGKPKEPVQHENAKMLDNQSKSEETNKKSITFEQSSSLILSIISEQFLEQGMNVINQKLTKEVKDVHVPVKIIFPFLNERDALLKFDTHEEMNEFRKCFLNDHFQLNDLPAQAVTCLNATVSQTAKMRFIEHGWNPDDIVENSGVAIKIQNECLVLEGSLLELQAARKFIQSACNQRKASVGEIQNSTDVENESLEFNNSLDIQTSKRTSQKEVSKTGEDIFDARQKVQIEETSNTNKSENDLRKLDKNVNTDISNTSISSSTPIAGEMEHQEPVEQSIREKVNMSHLDYDILENLFHPSSEITRKVHINKKKNVVEVVGSRDSVQPFRKAMRDINGYKKIPIDLNSTDLKKFWIHKKNIQDLFPKVLVLLDEGKMYLIVQEEDPELKSIVLSILSPQYKKESRDDNKGPRMSDLGSDSDFPKMQQPSQKHSPVQKTTFGKIVFQKKDISVSVMHGDVLSFDIFDCLVSPTNEHLDLKKGGFSAAMLARAGEEVQKECSSKFTSYKRKIEVGNCVSTRAGNLKYSLIIHTVLCPWKSFGVSTHRDQDTLNHIKEVISRCLSEASKMKKKSIVFPAIGSGQSAIPHILLANGYRLGCESLQARTSLKEIYFVAKDSNFLSLVEKIFQTPLPWCSFWSTDDEYTFHVSNMCKVLVAKRDMQQESFVDALVVVEDPFMSGKGYLASAILKSGDRLYKNNREKLMKKNRPNGSAVICKYTGQLKFKAVVHIIMPDSKIKIWTENDVEVYKKCISNALKSLKPADRSIAMKLFVGGNKKRDVMMYFAKALTEAITEHITSEESTLQEILILNTDPMRHELVKEEFSRFTKNACNSNGYFESVVFVDCSSDLKTIETRL